MYMNDRNVEYAIKTETISNTLSPIVPKNFSFFYFCTIQVAFLLSPPSAWQVFNMLMGGRGGGV